jgi:hypothetical protein
MAVIESPMQATVAFRRLVQRQVPIFKQALIRLDTGLKTGFRSLCMFLISNTRRDTLASNWCIVYLIQRGTPK